MRFYDAQVSIPAVAIVYLPPIGDLIDEVARVFRKRMEGDSVDGKQNILCTYVRLVASYPKCVDEGMSLVDGKFR